MQEDEIPSIPPIPENSFAGSALQSAIAYLRRGLCRGGTYEGVDEWDTVSHQWKLFHDWAASHGLSLPPGLVPAIVGGREHDLLFDERRGRWLKFTKPATAGYVVEMSEGRLLMTPASPLQYLERWRLHNRLFLENVELVGLYTERFTHRIVISQQDWGADTPNWDEIDRAMVEDYQFERLRIRGDFGGYDSRAYFFKRFAVFDVRPVNCARTASGLVLPLDVIPQIFTRAEANILRTLR